MPTPALVNGNAYDYSSITLDVAGGGDLSLLFTEIAYSQALEPGKLKGTHPQTLGRTRGEHSAEGSITVYLATYYDILAKLGDGYMEVEWDATVTYADTGQPTKTDVLHRCRITNEDKSHSQGSDPLVVALDLDIIMIKSDGKYPILNALT